MMPRTEPEFRPDQNCPIERFSGTEAAVSLGSLQDEEQHQRGHARQRHQQALERRVSAT